MAAVRRGRCNRHGIGNRVLGPRPARPRRSALIMATLTPRQMPFRSAPWIAFGGSVALLAAALALWAVPADEEIAPDRPGGHRPRVIVHAAAALRPALEKAKSDFAAQYGTAVELRFDASETLLTKLKLS